MEAHGTHGCQKGGSSVLEQEVFLAFCRTGNIIFQKNTKKSNENVWVIRNVFNKVAADNWNSRLSRATRARGSMVMGQSTGPTHGPFVWKTCSTCLFSSSECSMNPGRLFLFFLGKNNARTFQQQGAKTANFFRIAPLPLLNPQVPPAL